MKIIIFIKQSLWNLQTFESGANSRIIPSNMVQCFLLLEEAKEDHFVSIAPTRRPHHDGEELVLPANIAPC